MVYDWDDKQEACYRMYVAERKSLDHVMKFFKDEGAYRQSTPFCATIYLVTL